MFKEPEFSDNHLLRLGPYNPMENVWSSVKVKIKRDLARKITSILRIVSHGSIESLRRVDEGEYECRNKWNVLEFAAQIFNNVADAINMMGVKS